MPWAVHKETVHKETTRGRIGKGLYRRLSASYRSSMQTCDFEFLGLIHTTYVNMSPDLSTDRVSLDIVDQCAYTYGPGGLAEPTSASLLCVRFFRRLCPLITFKDDLDAHSPRHDNNQVENRPSRLSLLAPPLTGYHLLNIGSVLVFGIWKVLLSDHKGLVVVTRVELILVMISGLVYAFFYYSCEWTFVGLTASQIVLRQDAGETPRRLPRFLQSQFGPSDLEIRLSF